MEHERGETQCGAADTAATLLISHRGCAPLGPAHSARTYSQNTHTHTLQSTTLTLTCKHMYPNVVHGNSGEIELCRFSFVATDVSLQPLCLNNGVAGTPSCCWSQEGWVSVCARAMCVLKSKQAAEPACMGATWS